MASILVSTWGGSASNSYVAYTEAASFITTSIVDFAAWTNATTVQREAALIEATRDIDVLDFTGERYTSYQKLSFPRCFDWNTSVSTSDLDQVILKEQVQKAVSHQALWILRQSGRNTHAERIATGIAAISETIGPIHESVTYAGRTSMRICPEAVSYLNQWLSARKVYRA